MNLNENNIIMDNKNENLNNNIGTLYINKQLDFCENINKYFNNEI